MLPFRVTAAVLACAILAYNFASQSVTTGSTRASAQRPAASLGVTPAPHRDTFGVGSKRNVVGPGDFDFPMSSCLPGDPRCPSVTF